MKVVFSFCFVTLAMLLHPTVSKNESSFRSVGIYQTDSGYAYFDSMAITSSEDLNAFLVEISKQVAWSNRQAFVDALLNANVDFNKETLVLLRYDHPYGGSPVPVGDPVLKDKTLLWEFRDEIRGGLDIMAYHCFALAVSKSLVDKVQVNLVGGFPDGRDRPLILLSTSERQPLKFRRNDEPPRPAPASCPKLIVTCPTGVLETGKTYMFKALAEGLKPEDKATYNWSVTSGEIVGGQETRSLAVRIKQPNKIVTAWVSLGEVDPYCMAAVSCSCGPTK